MICGIFTKIPLISRAVYRISNVTSICCFLPLRHAPRTRSIWPGQRIIFITVQHPFQSPSTPIPCEYPDWFWVLLLLPTEPFSPHFTMSCNMFYIITSNTNLTKGHYYITRICKLQYTQTPINLLADLLIYTSI